MHNFDENGLEKTMNGFGSMHDLTKLSKVFIEKCKNYKNPVIDVGCAYGAVVIPALEQGATVIANDMDLRHLDILQKRTPKEYLDKLNCVKGQFPDDLNFSENSLDAAHISFVLSFLNGEKVEVGLKKIYKWLNHKGELFIVNHTPFVKMIDDFLPIYESRKKQGVKWAGYIENAEMYIKKNMYSKNIPNQLHQFDIEILSEVLQEIGFVIKEAYYFTLPGIPEEYKLDGRECVGIIAEK